jgi:hypothetical protein
VSVTAHRPDHDQLFRNVMMYVYIGINGVSYRHGNSLLPIPNATATSLIRRWLSLSTNSVTQLINENLFGALPDFFKDEDELRAIWECNT